MLKEVDKSVLQIDNEYIEQISHADGKTITEVSKGGFLVLWMGRGDDEGWLCKSCLFKPTGHLKVLYSCVHEVVYKPFSGFSVFLRLITNS